jgi:hypothetical protein
MLTKIEFYGLLVTIVVVAVLAAAFCYSFMSDELDEN